MKKIASNQIISLFEKEAPTLFPALRIRRIIKTQQDYRATIDIDGNTYLFIIISCPYPFPSILKGLLKNLLNTAGYNQGNILLISSYFPSAAQSFLKENNFNYLDLSGNCRLDRKLATGSQVAKVSIQHTGQVNRYPESSAVPEQLFSKKSSRITRLLLENYPKIWKPLEIAKEVNVSPALVTKLVKALEAKGFVAIKGKSEIHIVEPGFLLDEWAMNYKIRKNPLVGKFYFNGISQNLVQEIWKLVSHKNMILTGVAGASLVAPFSQVTIVDLYSKNFEDQIKGLFPVERGENVRIYQPYDEGTFQFVRVIDRFKVASPIQLYLDLYNDPRRGKEQAEFLRHQELKF